MRTYINRLNPTLIYSTCTFPTGSIINMTSPSLSLVGQARPAIHLQSAHGSTRSTVLRLRRLWQGWPYPWSLCGGHRPHKLEKGALLSPDTPRYSTGYGELARQPTVLVETHSLKPYRQRVLGTYVLMEKSMRLLGKEREGLAAAVSADVNSRSTTTVLTWKAKSEPLFVIDAFREIAKRTIDHPHRAASKCVILDGPSHSVPGLHPGTGFCFNSSCCLVGSGNQARRNRLAETARHPVQNDQILA